MGDEEFEEARRNLLKAFNDDFRGFIEEGKKRVFVSDNSYHISMASKILREEIPGYDEAKTGRNPYFDYLKIKKAIYITKIPIGSEDNKFQRTVAILTNTFSKETVFRGKIMPQYEVLKIIALEKGYDFDLYTLQSIHDKGERYIEIATRKSFQSNVKNSSIKCKSTVTKANLLGTVGNPPSAVIVGNKVVGFIVNGRFKRNDGIGTKKTGSKGLGTNGHDDR